MNIILGNHHFRNVKIPLLWGKRAIIGHGDGRISIIDLSAPAAITEIVAGTPHQGTEFSEQEDGYVIYQNGEPSYFFSPAHNLLRDLRGILPECEITNDLIRVGGSEFKDNMVSGFAVGIGVTEDGIFIGGPMPEGLAPLIV